MIRVEQGNRRPPILVLIAIGVLVIATLSLIPFAIAPKTNAERKEPPALAPAETSTDSRRTLAGGAPEFDAAAWYASRGEAPETHGLLVESFDHNHVYASHNADVAFNPASLIKLSTSLTALKKLGADYRFKMRVFITGTIDNAGTLRGSIFLSGGDPTFGDVEANMIGNELRQRGIKRIGGEINVAPDFCFNFSESPEDSGARLSRALRLGNPPINVTSEPAGPPAFFLSSHTLRELLLYMNARSSNFIAERVGALVGGPSGIQEFLVNELHLPPGEVTIERASGREHNRMTPRDLIIVLRALIDEINRQGLEPTDILPIASDDSGTLKRRLGGTGLEGCVVGKTGTLTSEVDGGMASLAGIVYTKDAGLILFAILDQGNRIADNRQMEDQLLSEIINTRATPSPIANANSRPLLPAANCSITSE